MFGHNVGEVGRIFWGDRGVLGEKFWVYRAWSARERRNTQKFGRVAIERRFAPYDGWVAGTSFPRAEMPQSAR